jgi:hypothetical protein
MLEHIAGWGRMLPAGLFMQNATSFVGHIGVRLRRMISCLPESIMYSFL